MALAPTPDEGDEGEADPEDSKAVWDFEDAEVSAEPDFSGESMTSRAKKPSAVPARIPSAKRIGDFMMNGEMLGLPGNYVSESLFIKMRRGLALGSAKKARPTPST